MPGVTAGIAAAASLQIPLTHRDVSHTVTFLSGHEAGGEEPSFEHLDLAALAGGKNTLLVYMGVTTAGHIAAKLIEAGFKPDLPVLAVENASREDERRVLATIAELAAHPERLGLKSPAVLIFGEVAGLPAAGVIEDILAAGGVEACLASSPPIASATASSSISPPTAAGPRRSAARASPRPRTRSRRSKREAAEAVKAREVVAVYPMDVALHDGAVDPLSVRERIRAAHRTTLTKDWYDVPL